MHIFCVIDSQSWPKQQSQQAWNSTSPSLLISGALKNFLAAQPIADLLFPGIREQQIKFWNSTKGSTGHPLFSLTWNRPRTKQIVIAARMWPTMVSFSRLFFFYFGSRQLIYSCFLHNSWACHFEVVLLLGMRWKCSCCATSQIAYEYLQ